MEFILNGADINNREEFYDAMMKLPGMPDFFGKNLDALWDTITGFVEQPLTIIWKDFAVSKINLGEYLDLIKSIFDDVEKAGIDFNVIYL